LAFLSWKKEPSLAVFAQQSGSEHFMRAGRPAFKRVFSLIQAVLVIACAQTPMLAAQSGDGSLSYADLNTLNDCEKKFYGGPHASLPSAERVGALETQVFGETKKGSLSARIASLRSTLAANSPSLLAPPLAAKMDNTQDQPPATPKTSAPAVEDATADLPPVAPQIDHAKNALHQALTLYQQGKLSDAEIAFKRVLAIDHDNTDANFNLGAIAEGRGDLQNAQKYYKAVLNINPNDGDAQSGLNAVQQKLASANIPSAAPNDRLPPPAAPSREVLRDRVSQASAAFKRGDYDGSIQILQNVAQQAPNEPDVQYARLSIKRSRSLQITRCTKTRCVISIAPSPMVALTTLLVRQARWPIIKISAITLSRLEQSRHLPGSAVRQWDGRAPGINIQADNIIRHTQIVILIAQLPNALSERPWAVWRAQQSAHCLVAPSAATAVGAAVQ
jgi:tetratricopeptide (TPR) repeat protein